MRVGVGVLDGIGVALGIGVDVGNGDAVAAGVAGTDVEAGVDVDCPLIGAPMACIASAAVFSVGALSLVSR